MSTTIKVRRQTRADAQRLFAVLADPHSYRSFPGVRSASLLRPGATERHGLGALRRIEFGAFRFDEEITHYEPGVRLDYLVVDSRPAIEHESGTIRFTCSDDGTDVEWISTFRVPTPLIGRLAARFGARRMSRAFDDAIRIGEQLALAGEHGNRSAKPGHRFHAQDGGSRVIERGATVQLPSRTAGQGGPWRNGRTPERSGAGR